ncbi:uncharacterized protein LOC143661327 [Tamandua tetradactyla]|uniref:uncharacterized protein LOC143661327 n=1 Tax=Tamandua tetradactyla TaxID=48850 RepID=UPI00405476BA
MRKLHHANNAQLDMAEMRTGWISWHAGYIEEALPPLQFPLGMVVMWAWLINWHAGNIEMGSRMMCKAYAILLVTHGHFHLMKKDLEASSISGRGSPTSSELSEDEVHSALGRCIGGQADQKGT